MRVKMQPKVSIIIPFRDMNSDMKKCIEYCLNIDYPNYDIILLPDSRLDTKFSDKVRIFETGPVYPSIKRNIGSFKCECEILAFIDSDAYPEKDWITNTVGYFKDDNVGIVGGKNMLPPDSTLLEKAAQDILYSKLGTHAVYQGKRYKDTEARECNEMPSCNMFMRKKFFDEIKGFNEKLPIGEDADLCFKVIEQKYKILYSPKTVVYHKTRRLFWPHSARIALQAKYKALLFKRHVLTNLSLKKVIYFMPTLLVFWLLVGLVVSFINKTFMYIFLGTMITYAGLILFESVKVNDKREIPFMIIGAILTHIFYGIGFFIGLLSKNDYSS